VDNRICIQDYNSCKKGATQEHGRRREEINMGKRGTRPVPLFFSQREEIVLTEEITQTEYEKINQTKDIYPQQ
jgi:hypothetical protein